MKIKAILFDMIGTTVREKDPSTIMNCLKLAFEKHGVIPDDEIIRANRGKDKMQMIKIVLQKGNHPDHLSASVFESFKENLSNNLNNFESAENVEDTFKSLKKMGIQIGLGSGLPRLQFENILDHLHWHKEDFQYIGISGELGKARPDPIMILDMMERLSIREKTALIKVGDTIADVEEGRNAGVKTVAVLSGTQAKDKLVNAQPDYLIDEIRDIVELVKSLR